VSKLAVITGGGRGIGAALASAAAGRGYRVAVWDRDVQSAREIASSLPEATAADVDVTDEGAVSAAFASLGQAPDLVVNNAGAVRFGPLLDLALADWRFVLDVNLTGTFLTARIAARAMAAAGGGTIVNVASVNGVSPAPNAGAYTSSKAGVIMLTEQMAVEWASFGVRVNCVAPGLIDAGMSEAINADPTVRSKRQSQVPLGRLGLSDDIASAVLFLASAEASYITGQTLVVDGGLTKTALASLSRPRSVDQVGDSDSDSD
jgi:NAD(P)-dependent dehydrogenase (short-subunit alcohol dehydrogenase family)